MKHVFIIIVGLIIINQSTYGQFSKIGKIEFVRTSNIQMALKLEYGDELKNNPWLSEMMKKLPKNATKHYIMSFDQDRSYYAFEKDGPEKMPNFGGTDPASENIVIKDYSKNTYTAQKELFTNLYLVKDTLPRFEWKIEDAFRQIAGFNCRKATTVLFDSVVVVAFYTEELLLSSGPESFGGLPGMILGIAIPRLYTTWFATKVEYEPFDESLIKPFDKKAKELTINELQKLITERTEQWGDRGKQMIYKAGI